MMNVLTLQFFQTEKAQTSGWLTRAFPNIFPFRHRKAIT
jgi:hypothetical protein